MKLAKAMATKNMETSTTADVLVSHLLSPMGVPEKNYMQMGGMFKLQRVKRTPYRSHLNGQIERGYRTMLSVATVQLVLLAYRTRVYLTTGVNLYKMLFGREVTLLVDIIIDIPRTPSKRLRDAM
ncbi:hypothetical protein T4B_3252 [Trichinella pseudospiralis]|uniref:Integrase catalytic domain-containing protein n=1 Tax=Trichinella pseudospiralis TaxID=6337 RepID=A0A0V1J853_TRIPS|nr:hypothetical protein T4B_3252 [Trichinella pseudospiralis]